MVSRRGEKRQWFVRRSTSRPRRGGRRSTTDTRARASAYDSQWGKALAERAARSVESSTYQFLSGDIKQSGTQPARNKHQQDLAAYRNTPDDPHFDRPGGNLTTAENWSIRPCSRP